MSSFEVNVVARNPKDETMATAPIEALVDTGSELTWLPADALAQIGVNMVIASSRKPQSWRDLGMQLNRRISI